MRKKFALMLFAIGLSATASIKAQGPGNNSPQSDQSKVKPCAVIVGAVRSPVRLELRRRVRLAEALVAAGGLTDRAASTIQIIKSGTKCIPPGQAVRAVKSAPPSDQLAVINIADIPRGDQKSNPYLEGGDIVIVTELDPIYIVGSVFNSREIYPKGPLTLTQAIKLAGGVISDASIRKVMIYRQKKDSPGMISIEVDLQEIRKHRAEDPILQPFDIVNVGATGQLIPRSPYPTFDSRPLIPPGLRVIH